MKRVWLSLSILAALVSAGVGCAGSETGNSAQPREKHPVSIEMRLTASGPGLTSTDQGGTVFTLASAFAAVERIDLVLPAGVECEGLPGEVQAYSAACDTDDHVRIEGPWVVDLVSGEFEPALAGIDVLDGVFDRIDMKLSPGAAGTGGIERGDALDGATLDVSGTAELGGSAARLFGLTLAFNVKSRFEDGNAIAIGEDADTVELSFDVSDWFATLDLGDCIAADEVPTIDGVLRLEGADRRACGDVEKAVRRALSGTGKAKVVSHGPDSGESDNEDD